MNIYLSTYDAIEHVNQSLEKKDLPISGIHLSSGWGRMVKLFQSAIEEKGKTYDLFLVSTLQDADVEIFIGQPQFKSFPSMSPNIFYTMIETTGMPSSWIDTLNRWDLVLNPSRWGVQNFQNLIKTPTKLLHLFIDLKNFSYIKREPLVDGRWNYLTMGVNFADRKNTKMVADIFRSGKMPSDTHLTVKLIPLKDQEAFAAPSSDQLYILNANLPFKSLIEDIFARCHVSVNPSRAEGFGFLGVEHSLTGMLSLCSNYSGYQEFLQCKDVLPIEGREVPSPTLLYGGKDFQPSRESVLKQMLWSYENREEALVMGWRSAKWIRDYFADEKILLSLRDILVPLVSSTPKKLLPTPIKNFDQHYLINYA